MARPRYITEEIEEFRRAFRSFVEREVSPRIEAWEKGGGVPREFWHDLGRHGYLCPWLDERYGGSSAAFGFSVVICEELGRTGAMGLQTALSVHADITVPYLEQLASEGVQGTVAAVAAPAARSSRPSA